MRNLFIILLFCGVYSTAFVHAQNPPSLLQDMGYNMTVHYIDQDAGITYYTVADLSGTYLWANHGTYATQVGSFPGKVINAFPGIPGHSEFYFVIGNGINSEALWRTDGTVPGTVQVDSLNRDLLVLENVVLNNRVFCAAYNPNATVNPYGFFITDGSINGGTTVDGLPLNPLQLHVVPGSGLVTFLFQATSMHQVWQTDGTNSGTQIHPYLPTGQDYSNFGGILQGKGMYTLDKELWTSDGTLAGTILLKQFQGTEQLVVSDIEQDPGTYYFFSHDYGQLEARFWKTDGTAANTILIASLSNAQSFYRISRINGEFFFTTYLGGGQNYDLYHSDGTSSGTDLLGNLANQLPGQIHSIGNPARYYFGAQRSAALFDFWAINLQQDTLELMNGYGLQSDIPFKTQTSQGELHYFFHREILPPNDHQIWVTDGTASGMQLLTQYDQNIVSKFFSFPGRDSVFYFLQDSTTRAQLWKIGSTPGSEQLVTTLGDSTARLGPPEMFFHEGKYYFSTTFAYNGGGNSRIGVTDGTAGGTQVFPPQFRGASDWHHHYQGQDSTPCFVAETFGFHRQLWTFGNITIAVEPGEDDHAVFNEALLFPNPGNVVRLRLPAESLRSGAGHYTLTDVHGRQVAQGAITREEQVLPSSWLPAGIYLVRVSAGGQHWRGKWVKIGD